MHSVAIRSVRSVSKVYRQEWVRFASAGISPVPKVKPVHELPGPLKLPLIGSLWQYLPVIGLFDLKHLHKIGGYYYKKYGPIVYERIGTANLVHIFKPEHFEVVINATFNRPLRNAFLVFARYRRSNSDKYNSPGIMALNNEEWWKLRQSLQKPLSPLKETRDFLGPTDDITKEFIDQLKSGETIHDFTSLANRLNMELTCVMLFNERVNCFYERALKDSNLTYLITLICQFAEGIAAQDRAEMSFSYIRDRNYRKVAAEFQTFELFVMDMINKVKARENLAEDPSIIARYMTDPSVHEKEILGAAIDLLMGGVHSTSLASSFLLYQLCKSPEAQFKMIKEAKRLLPSPDSKITKDVLNEAVFTRSVVKETFRLNPIAPVLLKILSCDVIVDNYRIPKDTMVFLHMFATCRLEENFKDALEFKPERWMRDSPDYQHVHPLLSLPFGSGLRSCIARRRAEQNLLVFALRLFRRFGVKWMSENELSLLSPSLMKPDGFVKLMFNRHS